MEMKTFFYNVRSNQIIKAKLYSLKFKFVLLSSFFNLTLV